MFYFILDILIVLTQQSRSVHCQSVPTNIYTAEKIYYKTVLGLTEIPTDIPTDALEVWLWHNRISKIRKNAFFQLSQCTNLQLTYNEISEVESGAFTGLIALKILNLDRNRLNRLEANMFYGLISCERLYLHNNQISEVETGSFNGLTSLDYFELQHNQITALRAGMFQGLVALAHLSLASNKINVIQDNAFFTLKKLQKLYLSNNDLGTLSIRAFNGLDSLTHLYLYENYLTTLPADTFSHLPRPLELLLHLPNNDLPPNNPIECDSKLCWLKQEELQGTITWLSRGSSVFKPRCANGIVWDNWSCVRTSKISLLILLAHLRVCQLSGCDTVATFDHRHLFGFGILYIKSTKGGSREGILLVILVFFM